LQIPDSGLPPVIDSDVFAHGDTTNTSLLTLNVLRSIHAHWPKIEFCLNLGTINHPGRYCCLIVSKKKSSNASIDGDFASDIILRFWPIWLGFHQLDL
jgi:hypothetical protein